MATDHDVYALMNMLEARYGDTHRTFYHLRNFWNGKMWADEASMTRSLVSVFRDLRHGDGSVGNEPDVKVTLPLVEAVVAKFMALLAPTPQISMIRPPIGFAGLRKDDTTRALADQNEKFLYGLWEQNRVGVKFNRQSFYLPLFGCCFAGVQPDFDSKTMKFEVRSPEVSFPVWEPGYENLRAIGFRWKMPQDMAVASYGDPAQVIIDEMNASKGVKDLLGLNRNQPPAIDVVEFWDKSTKRTLLAGKDATSMVSAQFVQHDLGFVPWVMPSFYDVPDEPFARGVIEGNAGLFQKMNMLDSLELQSIIENVFARIVIINPAVAPEDIDNGPGGVIPVGVGGDVKWVTPPATTTDLGKSMARSLDFSERGTHLPGSMYGEGVASSITTGKAQHESTLPTGNVVDYVQGNIANSWERLNEMAIDMTGKVFANREVVYFGRQYDNSGIFRTDKQFAITIKGSDLKNWSRHSLTFSPLLNMHEKVVIGLQLGGGGLVSKRWQRDQIGIVDNDAMQEEILTEMRFDQTIAGLMQGLQAGQYGADYVEQAFLAMEKGQVVPPAPAPVAPAGPAPAPAGGGQLPSGPLPPPMPPGAPAGPAGPPDMGAPPPATPPSVGTGLPQGNPGDEFTLQGAIGDFSTLRKLKGQVFLIGEIAQKGSTNGPVEVALTDMTDKSTIVNGLPDEYHGNLKFTKVGGEPEEPHVEVGPNAPPPAPGGPDVGPPPGGEDESGFSVNPVMASGARSLPPLASNYGPGGVAPNTPRS